MHFYGTMGVNGAGHLTIGGCDTVELARRFGTPLYVMDETEIRRRARAYRESLAAYYPDSEVIYAGKAFMTMAMCRLVESEGLGLDLVSGGEIYTALQAAFPMERVYFHGNNKAGAELRLALESGVGQIVVDNLHELRLLAELAGEYQRRVRILLRVTPGVEAHTHAYIQTGQVDSKFGFPLAGGLAAQAVKEALSFPYLELVGLHCHIGSQIFSLESFEVTIGIMLDFLADLAREPGWRAQVLNLGGGLGIRYNQEDQPVPIEEFSRIVAAALRAGTERRGLPLPKLVVEPGRSIVGEAGTTLYTVGAIKEIPGVRKYVAVDGGMGDNPRVALYQAVYEATVANKAMAAPEEVVSVAGKCCESGDMLIWDIKLPRLEPGDILAVFATGAYNYSMASNYNRLGRPAVVLVHEGEADLIVAREELADLVRLDRIPARLARPQAETRMRLASNQ